MLKYLITEDLFSPGFMEDLGVENLKDLGVHDDTDSWVFSSDSLSRNVFIYMWIIIKPDLHWIIKYIYHSINVKT